MMIHQFVLFENPVRRICASLSLFLLAGTGAALAINCPNADLPQPTEDFAITKAKLEAQGLWQKNRSVPDDPQLGDTWDWYIWDLGGMPVAHLKPCTIRGEGTSDDYFPAQVPALPSFKLHKFVSDKIVSHGMDYRTGVVYTTNRRVWEHDQQFHKKLREMTCIGIDMETATLFIVGHSNEISRGALLLVSDVPLTPDGIKTEASDQEVTASYSDLHLQIGIEAMTEIGHAGDKIKHFRY